MHYLYNYPVIKVIIVCEKTRVFLFSFRNFSWNKLLTCRKHAHMHTHTHIHSQKLSMMLSAQ